MSDNLDTPPPRVRSSNPRPPAAQGEFPAQFEFTLPGQSSGLPSRKRPSPRTGGSSPFPKRQRLSGECQEEQRRKRPRLSCGGMMEPSPFSMREPSPTPTPEIFVDVPSDGDESPPPGSFASVPRGSGGTNREHNQIGPRDSLGRTPTARTPLSILSERPSGASPLIELENYGMALDRVFGPEPRESTGSSSPPPHARRSRRMSDSPLSSGSDSPVAGQSPPSSRLSFTNPFEEPLQSVRRSLAAPRFSGAFSEPPSPGRSTLPPPAISPSAGYCSPLRPREDEGMSGEGIALSPRPMAMGTGNPFKGNPSPRVQSRWPPLSAIDPNSMAQTTEYYPAQGGDYSVGRRTPRLSLQSAPTPPATGAFRDRMVRVRAVR